MHSHSVLLFLTDIPKGNQEKIRERRNVMENRNIFDLFKQYNEQSKETSSLANGEIEARDGCLDMCDCCSSWCLCTATCIDCFS